MIANAPTTCSALVPQQTFAAMLPAIVNVASYAFRRQPFSRREELITETIANAYVAFVRLMERGLAAVVFPTVLAKYAVRQVRQGRQVGGRQNSNDVLSPNAQRQKGFSVRPLQPHNNPRQWEELIADRKANPADVAACRVDFRNWIGRLNRFKRQVALRLAGGDTPADVARHFNVSRARISQLRRELSENWNEYQAQPVAA